MFFFSKDLIFQKYEFIILFAIFKYAFSLPNPMKERVTLTLDRDILRSIDKRIDGSTIKNRSHAIEIHLRKALRQSVPGTAIILAGGSRSSSAPALAEVDGKQILHYNIDLCLKHGIRNIVLCVGGASPEVKKTYGDGSALGAKISYLDEMEPLGTAGVLRLLQEDLHETFVVLNGDELKDIHIRRMYQEHVDHEAKATLALTTTEDPSDYGVALMDGSKIIRFIEKPVLEDAPSRLISAGLYIFEPEMLALIPEGFAMMETEVFPKLAKEGTLHGYLFSGQWLDTENADTLLRAKQVWKGFTNSSE